MKIIPEEKQQQQNYPSKSRYTPAQKKALITTLALGLSAAPILTGCSNTANGSDQAKTGEATVTKTEKTDNPAKTIKKLPVKGKMKILEPEKKKGEMVAKPVHHRGVVAMPAPKSDETTEKKDEKKDETVKPCDLDTSKTDEVKKPKVLKGKRRAK